MKTFLRPKRSDSRPEAGMADSANRFANTGTHKRVERSSWRTLGTKEIAHTLMKILMVLIRAHAVTRRTAFQWNRRVWVSGDKATTSLRRASKDGGSSR